MTATNIKPSNTTYWLRDHEHLAIINQHLTGLRLEVHHYQQAHPAQILREQLAEVVTFRYSPHAHIFTFWGQTNQGYRAEFAYHPDGSLLYEVSSEDRPGWQVREYWSPNWKMVALKIGQQHHQSPLLGFTNGRPPILVKTELKGLRLPRWSPDSQWLAFTYSENKMPDAVGTSLAIVNNLGESIWNYTPISIPENIE